MTAPRKRVPVSVLVPTKNEETNLHECLGSLRWADEVVLVDSGSTDRTAEIAAEYGARVVDFAWNGRFPKKKNWALENVDWRHEWVLIVDADERIPPRLAREIARAIRTGEFDGYYLNRCFRFMDGWLRHCGYYPSWNLRLFRHRLGRYERIDVGEEARSGDNEVHEHVLLEGGRAGYLKHDMIHDAYPTIDVWVEKHNRYSNWEAVMALREEGGGLAASPFGGPLERRRWIRRQALRLPFRPLLRFLYHYVVRQGFRDGYRGYVFCRLMAMYEFWNVAKANEKRRLARRPGPVAGP